MGTCYTREKEQILIQDVFESSTNFWGAPSLEELFKQHRPVIKYSIPGIYKGERTVLTEEEVHAARKILAALRRWRHRRLRRHPSYQVILVTEEET